MTPRCPNPMCDEPYGAKSVDGPRVCKSSWHKDSSDRLLLDPRPPRPHVPVYERSE